MTAIRSSRGFFEVEGFGLPASRKAITSSRPFRESVMENRFVFVAKLLPSSIGEQVLEESEDFGGGGFRLPVHSPDDGFLAGCVGKGLSESEAGSNA